MGADGGGGGDDPTRRHPVAYRMVKVFNIGYVAVLYICLGFLVGCTLNYVLPRHDAAKKKRPTKPLCRLLVEIIAHFWLVSLVVYAVRKLVERIPSPLEGVCPGLPLQKIKNQTHTRAGGPSAWLPPHPAARAHVRRPLHHHPGVHPGQSGRQGPRVRRPHPARRPWRRLPLGPGGGRRRIRVSLLNGLFLCVWFYFFFVRCMFDFTWYMRSVLST